MRPKNICIIPMITENFIFKELVNDIALLLTCHTGSIPNGYGLPLNIKFVVTFGSGFKSNVVTCSKPKSYLKKKVQEINLKVIVLRERCLN